MQRYPEQWIPASSFGMDPRREPCVIVLHHTAGSGDAASQISYLQTNPRHVSIHRFIDKQGNRTRMVEDKNIAYHVGYSKIGSLGNPNTSSLGIELMNTGSKIKPDPYPHEQIQSCAEVVAYWLRQYPIQMVTSHAGIDTKGKYDPYNFPWSLFWQYVGHYQMERNDAP